MTADERAQARCRKYEGRRLVGGRHVPYRGPAGKPIVGYGHLRRGDEWRDGMTEQEARQLFRFDWNEKRDAIENLLAEIGRGDLGDVRRGVLVEMAFQMGVAGCRGFALMWKALGRRDYGAAAAEMLDSEWWRNRKTRRRCERLADIMAEGRDLADGRDDV